MDDFDDMLNDLLAEDTVPAPKTKKKKSPAKAGGARRLGKGSTVHDDDFFEALAAGAVDSVSDVSEADPNQMLASMDDMDAALFGPKKGGPQKTVSVGASRSAAKPSTPPSPSKSIGAGTITPKTSPAKKQGGGLDFNYDDPLAGLLSDDDTPRKPKRSEVKAKPQEELKTEGYKPSSTPSAPPAEADDSSSESRRLEINRPPTRSGNQKKGPSKQDIFDDDDVLGMFDESPRSKPVARVQAATQDKGRSIMDDLLGTGSATKHLDPPGSSESGGAARREFVLDKKYMKQEAKPKEFSEDDFGDYMPSAVTTPGSRPSSKRSVRFEGDMDDDAPKSRSGSGGGGQRGGGAAAILEDMITKDDRNWLDIASNEPSPAPKDRPHSEGSIRSQREPEKPSTAQSSSSEPVDWLGLSRLGSPKLTSKDNDLDNDLDLKPQPRLQSGGGRAGIPKELPDEPNDWLGPSSSSKKRTNEETEAPTEKAEDWLGVSSGKDSNWLGMKDTSKESAEPDDWLGFSKGSDTGKSDDWLVASNNKDSPTKDTTASGDYLGINAEIDDPFAKNTSKARADERGLDLFSPPAAKDNSTSFPWDSESQGNRRTRSRSKVQQKAMRPQSPVRGASPKHSVSPRGPSPADSPRDLMATLDALKKMDGQQKKPSPIKATPISTAAPVVASTTPSAVLSVAGTGEMGIMNTPSTAGLGISTSGVDINADMSPSLFTSSPMPSSQMDDFRQQQEMFRKQQQMLMEQQQKQQIEQQRVMAEQQERRRQQMDQMAEAQTRMMQQQMSAMTQSAAQMPQMSMMSGMGFGSSMLGDELLGQVKRLEMEKVHLLALLETTRNQHQEEIKLLDDSHKKRTEMVEESWSRREQRLKEENEFLMNQSHSKMQQVEAEKAEMLESHLRKVEAWDREHRAEIDRIREQQRSDIDSVRREHEESLVRLRHTKDLELEAVTNQHSTTQNLRGVLDTIAENTRGLNELQSQVHLKHNLNLDERELSARNRDEQLKALHDRLERQYHDNEKERGRLQGLLTTMEAQLTEQVRINEEEKWRVRQEESRLQVAHESLEKEKIIVMEQLKRERAGIQKSKDQLLDEQKTVLAQLYEEQRQLAQNRAAYEMDTKLNIEKAQCENIKNIKTGAELEGSVRIINDEKARLAQQLDKLRMDRDQLSKERTELEQQQKSLAVEKEKLETIALQVRQRSKDIEDMCLLAAQAREAGETSLAEAQRLEGDQRERLQAIQAQLQTLHTKERQIAQERLSLAKERQAIDTNAKSLMCVSCRTPVRDTPGMEDMTAVTTGMHTIQATPLGSHKMTPAAASLFNSLDPDLKAKVSSLDSVSAEIEMDRSIRLWRIAAKKDEDFLMEESMFLQAIRHMPYSDKST